LSVKITEASGILSILIMLQIQHYAHPRGQFISNTYAILYAQKAQEFIYNSEKWPAL
jgi:hypothetical protein